MNCLVITKNLQILVFSLQFPKLFLIPRTIFLTVGQNNFNKVPFLCPIGGKPLKKKAQTNNQKSNIRAG